MKRTQQIFIREDGNGTVYVYCPLASKEVKEEIVKLVNTNGDIEIEKVGDYQYKMNDVYGLYETISFFGFGMNFKYVGQLNDGAVVMEREVDLV